MEVATRDIYVLKVKVYQEPRSGESQSENEDSIRNYDADMLLETESEDEDNSVRNDDADIFNEAEFGDGNMVGDPGMRHNDAQVPDTGLFDERPIQPGTDVKKGEALALLMAFALRHNLTRTGLGDLIGILNIISPGCVPHSKYYVDQCLSGLTQEASLHYYCPHCAGYLGIEPANECIECGTEINRNDCKKNGCYFMTMSMRAQLANLFSQPRIQHKLRGDFGMNFRGNKYEHRPLRAFMAHRDNVTISFSADGVSVFKSSKFSIWPILVTIDELPLKDKVENVMLHTLWFGKNKPRIDTFMKPFVEEVKALYADGFEWFDANNVRHVSKVMATVCVADAVARCMLQNFKQFNGSYGCGFCVQKGEVVEKGNGHVRVFPVAEDLPERRQHDQTYELARMATERADGLDELGVKGPTPLMLLPHFNVIDGFVPDYMHAVCLGVVKQFAALWFDSTYSGQPFHLIAPQIAAVDELLLNVRPPAEIRRHPRSLTERKYWKASEWRTFLLLFSGVVLQDVLPRRFLAHWFLLVYGISVFMQSNPCPVAMNKAHIAVIKFVSLVPELYGREHVSYNVHVLTHLFDSVSHWGPLWVNSAFLYEDTCRRLVNMFNGSRAVPLQMLKVFSASRVLLQKKECLMNRANEEVRSTFEKLTGAKIARCNAVRMDGDVVAFGSQKQRLLLPEERRAFVDGNVNVPIDFKCLYTSRIVVKGRAVSTAEYAAKFKEDNSNVILVKVKMS